MKQEKEEFWPAFWLSNMLFVADWIVVWSGGTSIPHRVNWFFFYIPGVEVLALVVFAVLQPRFTRGIMVTILLQGLLYLPQFLFLALYAGLGDAPGFFS